MASANEIPAGGEGKIDVKVHAGARKQAVRQVVTVQTNDPAQPTTQITIVANVLVDLEVIPSILRVDQTLTSGQVTLRNYTNDPIELKNLQSSSAYVKASLSSTTIPANGEVVLTGELLPEVPEGNLTGWIKIESNLITMPVIQIPIWGRIQK